MSIKINGDGTLYQQQQAVAADTTDAFAQALSAAQQEPLEAAPLEATPEQAAAAEEAAGGAQQATTEQASSSNVFGSSDATAMFMMMMLMGSSGLGGSGDGMGSGINEVLITILMSMLGNTDSSRISDMPILESTGGKWPVSQEEYDEVVTSALERLGDPYSQKRAGQGDYTDCSYLTRWAYREVGVELPRTAAAQAKYCVDNDLTIDRDELQPGDLIFYSLKKNGRFMNVSHVGIYAGGGKMVDASSANGKVVHRDVFEEGLVLYGRPA